MAVTAVLFDLGNVVVDWNPLLLYRQIFDSEDEAQRFVSEICTLKWHTEHDRGVTFADNAVPLIEAYPHYEDQIRAWRTRWLDMFSGYVPGMDVLLADVFASRADVFALSNLSDEVWQETADAFPLLHKFEDVVVSGAEKVVKPDPKIYEIARQRAGRPAEEILFTDDRMDNLVAAEAFGFKTHHFQGAHGLREALIHHGVLTG
mgnify:CR=1 FL=1